MLSNEQFEAAVEAVRERPGTLGESGLRAVALEAIERLEKAEIVLRSRVVKSPPYQPIDVEVAIALYIHNDGPMPLPKPLTAPKYAKAFVDRAMDKYGDEAVKRNTANGVRD